MDILKSKKGKLAVKNTEFRYNTMVNLYKIMHNVFEKIK
jgi:hypothetical protein